MSYFEESISNIPLSKVLQNDHLTIRFNHHLSETPQTILVQPEFSSFDKNHPLVVTALLLLLRMTIPTHGLALFLCQ